MTVENLETATLLISFCGQCQCGCYDLTFHADNPPERAFSIANTTGTVFCGEELLRQLIIEAPDGAKDIIVHHPDNPPEQEYNISLDDASVYLNADDRTDLLRRASNGELRAILDRCRQPATLLPA